MSIEVGNKIKYVDLNNNSLAGTVITYDNSKVYVSFEGTDNLEWIEETELEVIEE